MSKEFDIDCLLKSIDYNLTDIARAEFHKWLRAKDKQIADLEAKLAEKECEIKQLNNIILISQLQAPEEQRLKIIGSSCCQYNPKRDKISFGIERLEKVKEHFINIKTPTLGVIRRSEMVMYIDNQIEELKKENERENNQI